MSKQSRRKSVRLTNKAAPRNGSVRWTVEKLKNAFAREPDPLRSRLLGILNLAVEWDAVRILRCRHPVFGIEADDSHLLLRVGHLRRAGLERRKGLLEVFPRMDGLIDLTPLETWFGIPLRLCPLPAVPPRSLDELDDTSYNQFADTLGALLMERQDERIRDEGEVVAEQEWDSGGPGAGAGVSRVIFFKGRYWGEHDAGREGPFESLDDAAWAAGVYHITDATVKVQVRGKKWEL